DGRVAGHPDHVRVVPPAVAVGDPALHLDGDHHVLLEVVEHALAGDVVLADVHHPAAAAAVAEGVADDLGKPGARAGDHLAVPALAAGQAVDAGLGHFLVHRHQFPGVARKLRHAPRVGLGGGDLAVDLGPLD